MAEKSAPIPVTDLDICYTAGVPMSTLTLWPTDELEILDNGDIIVTFKVKAQERITIKEAHIVWWATRERLVVPSEKEVGAPS